MLDLPPVGIWKQFGTDMDQETKDNNQLNLVEIREKLAGMKGQAYWRGLEEIAETEEFQQWCSAKIDEAKAIQAATERPVN